MTYSSSGSINKDEMFDINSKRVLYYTFQFDFSNNMTGAILHDSAGNVLQYMVFVLNSAGDPVKEVYLDKDSVMTGYAVNEYNSSGNLLTSSEYRSDSTLLDVYKYTYDAVGRALTSERYDTNNLLLDKYVNVRNSSGQLIQANQFNANGDKLGYKTYSFNSQAYTVTIKYYSCMAGTAKKTALAPWVVIKRERMLDMHLHR